MSYTDAGWWLLDNGNHPNESDEDREKRLDLLCRDVLDGKVDEDNLSDDEWIAVKLRVRENTQKRLQDFLQRAESDGIIESTNKRMIGMIRSNIRGLPCNDI